MRRKDFLLTSLWLIICLLGVVVASMAKNDEGVACGVIITLAGAGFYIAELIHIINRK